MYSKNSPDDLEIPTATTGVTALNQAADLLEYIGPKISHFEHKSQRTSSAKVRQTYIELERRYYERLLVDPQLTRQIVSFQANKERPNYRWYKYKEGFSAALVEYFLSRTNITRGNILDPFAGSGTTLFASSALGLDAMGIELLPIGVSIIEVRKRLKRETTAADLQEIIRTATERPWREFKQLIAVNELNITQGAYPDATRKEMAQYLAWAHGQTSLLKDVFIFALLCVLEQVSFTRKDGQYLRWDYRSGRQSKTQFDKGRIEIFGDAISQKLTQIANDIQADQISHSADLFAPITKQIQGSITLQSGSCLDLMTSLSEQSFDAVITSPPYCNRYDYTRTYALELALLGANEKSLSQLRQNMLSCTVENRPKDLSTINPAWIKAMAAAHQQEALQATLDFLDDSKKCGELNNNGIPRMVRGYFYEMACVIQECARVLKDGSTMIMVNDNVRYAGVSIPVDLILSDIAVHLNLETEAILVLPCGKGNSSQQMGVHGRDALRKCVYVWKKKKNHV